MSVQVEGTVRFWICVLGMSTGLSIFEDERVEKVRDDMKVWF